MRVLVVDNIDSFTHNLVQLIGSLGAKPTVVDSDEVDPTEATVVDFDRVVISPGPGRPAGAGRSLEAVLAWAEVVPILGVCLGHQVIIEAFGGTVTKAAVPRHGKASWITHNGSGVFEGLPNPFPATRYHSLVAQDIPDVLEPVAEAEDGTNQAVRHRTLPIWGVQFHPESVLTVDGPALMANFLDHPSD